MIPVKQHVGAAWKALGMKKNNITRSPEKPLSLHYVFLLKDDQGLRS